MHVSLLQNLSYNTVFDFHMDAGDRMVNLCTLLTFM